ncbi:hypothetical protein DXQ21_00180 [Listeria monocytogenes]|nr:hypothetical protein [Listeria monocytogenes]
MSTLKSVIGSIISMAFIFLGALILGALHHFLSQLDPALSLIIVFVLGLITMFIVLKTWK